jgi:hypothetical protein
MFEGIDRRTKILFAMIEITFLTAIISQLIMQLGGGPRDELMDLSDQLIVFGQAVIFENGLPPYISSAGVFAPESIVFGIGFTIVGVLIIWLSKEIWEETCKQFQENHTTSLHLRTNNIGLIAGMIGGIILVFLAWTPMNTQLVAHLVMATIVFLGSILWTILVTVSRTILDADKQWCGYNIIRLRWTLMSVAFISLQLSIISFVLISTTVSAAFEWLLFISLNCGLLTFYTVFENPNFEEE